ncbi:uncharacterized protein N7459_002243 [Penicillium hispanicum]|uniref:uncharacterized protein n=1 Tax=Penicillium hispanicum TaxID=1080232 RepID=UPI00254082B1|nr:uncharacterized protein N7459_002243 [Penicillium hispanicum]KAJ5591874.1 hypothetical protein N7459_002243 [Penicillium hispanicum]
MSFFKDNYNKFLANPKNPDVAVAANVSLFYVPTTTSVEGKDAVLTHTSRQSSIVKKKGEQIINAIESYDSLILDIETTLEFSEGGGAYLPSLDDNFLIDRVATFPTLHIVHYNAQNEIQQIRIYWDQGSLLKEVEVIGARGRSWPIRDAKEQVRLLKSAAAAKSTPPLASSHSDANDLPARPGSPGKRHFIDPYGAGSLTELLSPQKADAEEERNATAQRPGSPGKKHRMDPFAAASLTELLSPSKDTSQPVRPYAPSSIQPPARDLSALFIDDEPPATPSKSETVIGPKAGAGKSQGNRIFASDDELTDDRAPYKTDPRKFKHFEIGADNSELEVKDEPKRGKSRHQSQWDLGDFTTPVKPSRAQRAEEVRHFGYSDEGEDVETPPARPHVPKPRRDADVHFEMSDTDEGYEDDRIISSYQHRGQQLYENRLFSDNGEAMPSEQENKQQRPLSVAGNNINRQKDFEPHWEMTDASLEPTEVETEDKKSITSDHSKAVKQMESQWEMYDESPQPKRTATHMHNPSRHNQPTWGLGDEE